MTEDYSKYSTVCGNYLAFKSLEFTNFKVLQYLKWRNVLSSPKKTPKYTSRVVLNYVANYRRIHIYITIKDTWKHIVIECSNFRQIFLVLFEYFLSAGQKFAMTEAKIILVQIFRHFEVESAHGIRENKEILDLMLVPGGGAKIKIRKRLCSAWNV